MERLVMGWTYAEEGEVFAGEEGPGTFVETLVGQLLLQGGSKADLLAGR
jgi:hypothetical protein